MFNPKTDKKATGFTLVEMAIVLVIIGIILAGVMKGRDIVRGAQVKQFSQQFAQKWGTICQTYYDKTGQQFLDGDGNGTNANPGGGNAPDGRMDGALGTLINNEVIANGNGPVGTLNSVGITPCTLIKSKYSNTVTGPLTGAVVASCVDGGGNGVNLAVTQVEGEYAGSRPVEADLVFLQINNGVTTMGRNCVVLYDVPTDVAIGLDTALDGTVDGNQGSCANLENAAIGAPTALANGDDVATAAWQQANLGQTQVVGIILDF